MSAIAAYRNLLRIVGPAYILVAFLGRLPLAMSQMGALVMVSTATGSYGTGGAAAGAMAVANALGAPVAGAIADRIGQRPVVLVQSLAGASGLVALVWATDVLAPNPVIISVSAVAGLMMPQVGPLARVRWTPITAGHEEAPRLIDAAFSYEGAADEASFVFGPALVGLAAVLLNPDGALLFAAGLLAVFGTAFAVHPTAALTRLGADARRVLGRLMTRVFVLLMIAQYCVGMIFGGTQTGAAVLATAQGQPGVAGLIHAVLGVGSVAAGLAAAGLPERVTYAQRSAVAAFGLLVLSTPLLLVNSIGTLVLVIFLLGFAVAPYMISNFALAGQTVPSGRVSAAMTMLAGATGIGYASGSSLAGRLADWNGHTPAFAVTVGAAALATVVATIALCLSRR